MGNKDRRFAVASRIAVVGTNSEMAEVGNPRGEMFGEVFFVVCTSGDGSRLAHCASSTMMGGRLLGGYPLERLVKLADKLDTEQPDLNLDHWDEMDPVYGSSACVKGGYEEAYAHEEYVRDMERQWG